MVKEFKLLVLVQKTKELLETTKVTIEYYTD